MLSPAVETFWVGAAVITAGAISIASGGLLISASIASVGTVTNASIVAGLAAEGAQVISVEGSNVIPFVVRTADDVAKIFFAAA